MFIIKLSDFFGFEFVTPKPIAVVPASGHLVPRLSLQIPSKLQSSEFLALLLAELFNDFPDKPNELVRPLKHRVMSGVFHYDDVKICFDFSG